MRDEFVLITCHFLENVSLKSIIQRFPCHASPCGWHLETHATLSCQRVRVLMDSLAAVKWRRCVYGTVH